MTAWEEELERYRAATRIEQVEGTRGFSTETVLITRITYPDGATDERALGGPPEERIRRRFSAQHPPPAGAGPRSDQYDAWRMLADVQITRATGWRSAFVHGGRREDFDLGARGWDFGLPIVEIVAKLDALAADGWRVLDVSEDHGIYHGPHAQTDHFVTRARYLLGREATGVPGAVGAAREHLAVVQAVRAALPELDRVRHQAEAAPVRRARDRGRVARVHLGEPVLEPVAVRDRLGLA